MCTVDTYCTKTYGAALYCQQHCALTKQGTQPRTNFYRKLFLWLSQKVRQKKMKEQYFATFELHYFWAIATFLVKCLGNKLSGDILFLTNLYFYYQIYLMRVDIYWWHPNHVHFIGRLQIYLICIYSFHNTFKIHNYNPSALCRALLQLWCTCGTLRLQTNEKLLNNFKLISFVVCFFVFVSNIWNTIISRHIVLFYVYFSSYPCKSQHHIRWYAGKILER